MQLCSVSNFQTQLHQPFQFERGARCMATLLYKMWEDEKRKSISHYCKKTFRGVFAQKRGSNCLILVDVFSTRWFQSAFTTQNRSPVYSHLLMSVWMNLYFKVRMGTQRVTASSLQWDKWFSTGAKERIIVKGVVITGSYVEWWILYDVKIMG